MGICTQSGMNVVCGANVSPVSVVASGAMVGSTCVEVVALSPDESSLQAVPTSSTRQRAASGRCMGSLSGPRWGCVAPDGTLRNVALDEQKLPIKMLNDRVLVRIPERDGERRTTGGILIPATAQISKRLAWAEVVALGQNVRTAEVGDRVLFSPEDRYEVEVGGNDYIMLRERDIHAVAATRIEASTGLYL